MYLKRTGSRFSFLLSLTIITSAPGSWTQSPPPPAPPRGARSRSSSSSSSTRGPQQQQPLLLHLLRTPGAEGQRVSSSPQPADDACSRGQVKLSAPGRFFIVGQLEANFPLVGYQADSAAAVHTDRDQAKVRGQRLSGPEESWQRLQPAVECGDDAMVLVVRRRRAGNLLLDRVNESSVPLPQLPPQCGYSVHSTWRDLSLRAQYDACHVTQEGGSYVLPLLWRGAPVKMSCPVPPLQPHGPGQHAVCCSPYGMTVRLQGPTPAEQLRINVRGEWTPLVPLAELCGFTVDSRDAQTVIGAPYLTCGMTVKGGKYTLNLQMGENTLLLSCPVSSLEEVPGARLVDGPPYLSRIPTELPSEPFPWAAPFYLAPLYYPHPTHQHGDQGPDAHDVHDPLAPAASDPEVGPQPRSPADSHYPESDDSAQIPEEEMDDFSPQHKRRPPVLDLSESRSRSSAAASPAPVHAPSLPPPDHAFNPYYHYYHHPKIPLPNPPQDPAAAPEVPENPSKMNTHNPLVSPPSVQQPEADSDPSPPPQVTSHPDLPPAGLEVASYPYPHHYFYYFPHVARGEATRLTLHDPAAETSVPDVPPLTESSPRPVREDFSVAPDARDEPEKQRPGWVRNPRDEERPPATPAPPPSHPPDPEPSVVAPPLPHYHYYQMYYGPERSQSGDDHMSQASVQDASEPQLEASSSSSPTESPHHAMNGHLYPYYYYDYHHHLLHLLQPREAGAGQEQPPAGSEKSSSESGAPLPSDAEAGSPSIPQLRHGPLQQHLYYSSGPPGGEGAGERPDYDLTDQPAANTPSAAPCGLDPDSSCSRSLGSYPVEDCTMGHNLVFVVPQSVSEATVPPAARPSEDSEASCVLQRLTSDPGIYVVPLDGCGVNKLMFGQTVVHLLEVQGVFSPEDDHASEAEASPVRLMVECSSSPGSPGEVRLHVMDQPPAPPIQPSAATVSVQLRLSTDESFSSFHPEAHLPLSAVRGRALYLQVSLLEPPEENLVLLVHWCAAHGAAPHAGWMPIYDGCRSPFGSQLLPSSDPLRTWRILISSFLSLPPQSPSDVAAGRRSLLDDPEIYVFCSTEVCSAADGDCTSGCIHSLQWRVSDEIKTR